MDVETVAAARCQYSGMKLSALALLSLAAGCAAYRVLVVFPIPARSHGNLGDGIVRALLEAGHEVTYITPFPRVEPPPRLKQINVTFMFPYLPTSHMFDPTRRRPFSVVREIAYNISTGLLRHNYIQTLMMDKSQQFDVVISESFFSELYAGFAQVFRCPWVVFAPIGITFHMEMILDEVQSPAVNPPFMAGCSVPMSFQERIVSAFYVFVGLYSMRYVDRPHEAAAYRKLYTPAAQARGVTLPEYPAACDNIALLFSNSHPSFGSATRLPPNAVEIGGYHIEPDTKPLPMDLQNLLDNAPHGVIYFSMGSNLKSSAMTEETRRALLTTFGALKQTVLWKFEVELEGAPENIHVRSWMPQQSILAHKNVKLFITHGGLLSTSEAIHFGVPLIGMPVFGDQPMNMDRAVKKGYALKVDLHSPDLGTNLADAIHMMLNHPSYTATAKHLSQLFHDRPLPAARLVSYWTEYVVRTRGAPHLRTAATLVPAYQRYLLDIVALLVAALLLLFVLLRALVRFLLTAISGGSRKPVRPSKKNN